MQAPGLVAEAAGRGAFMVVLPENFAIMGASEADVIAALFLENQELRRLSQRLAETHAAPIRVVLPAPRPAAPPPHP